MQDARTLIFLPVLLITFTGCQDQEFENPPVSTSNTARTNEVARLSEPEAALLDAAVKGDTQRVKDLLNQGVNVKVKDQQGATPLAHAAWFGHIDAAKLLIEKGADVNAKKNDGKSVLELATMRGHNDIVELLKKAGTSEVAGLSDTALLNAAVKGDTQRVKYLLDQGVNVNVKDQQGATPLAHAAWFGHIDAAKLLIEKGADVNAKKNDGKSVLELATMKGHKDIVGLLKKAGAK